MATLIGLDGNVSIMSKPYENPDFNNAIASINPGVYRTPGSWMNNNHWKVDQPRLDNLKKMWELKKPKLIFGLNMLTKGLRNNLSMLQYAASIGLPVDYIEYGNEFNIFGCPARTVYPTVDDYAKTVAEWRKTIEQSFPNAQTLMVGENKRYADTVHWNSSCLEYNPDAGLVWHYHCPKQYVFDGVPDITILKDAILEEKDNVFSDVPISNIYMTEFSLEQGDHEQRTNPNFKDAASMGAAVTALCEKFTEINLPLVCYHNVIGADDKGCITSTRFFTRLDPPGTAIKAFINQIS